MTSEYETMPIQPAITVGIQLQPSASKLSHRADMLLDKAEASVARGVVLPDNTFICTQLDFTGSVESVQTAIDESANLGLDEVKGMIDKSVEESVENTTREKTGFRKLIGRSLLKQRCVASVLAAISGASGYDAYMDIIDHQHTYYTLAVAVVTGGLALSGTFFTSDIKDASIDSFQEFGAESEKLGAIKLIQNGLNDQE